MSYMNYLLVEFRIIEQDISSLTLKYWLYPAVIAVIFYYPLLNASAYYADDLYRAYFGTFGWSQLGRPFADITALLYSSTIDLQKPVIVDAYPFSWFLVVFLIVFSSVLIHLTLLRFNKKIAFGASLIFIINPFFVENMLYRFDSVGMFVAMTAVIIAFYIRNSTTGYFLKAILLLACLATYQVFFNLYAGLFGLTLVIMAISTDDILSFTLKEIFFKILKVITLLIAVSLIYFIVLKLFMPAQAAPRSDIIQLDLYIIVKIIINYFNAFFVFLDFWTYFLPYIAIIIPIMLFCMVKVLKEPTRLITGTLGILFLLFSTIGLMAILENQFYQPRGLTYFSVIMMAIFVIISSKNIKLGWVMLLPMMACFLFVARVGNSLSIQSEFEKPILSMAVKDLQSVNTNNPVYSIGAIKLSPTAKIISERTPFNALLKRSGYQTGGRLIHSGSSNTKFLWSGDYTHAQTDFNNRVKHSLSPTIIVKPYYEIYAEDNKTWIYWFN
jgi:hypothetical protein